MTFSPVRFFPTLRMSNPGPLSLTLILVFFPTLLIPIWINPCPSHPFRTMHESIVTTNLHKHRRDAHLIDIHTFGNIDSKLEVISADQLFLSHQHIRFTKSNSSRNVTSRRHDRSKVGPYQLGEVEQVIGIMLIRFQYFTIKHIKYEMWRNTVAHKLASTACCAFYLAHFACGSA